MLNYKNPRASHSNQPVYQDRVSCDIRVLTAKGGDHRTRAHGRNLQSARIGLAHRSYPLCRKGSRWDYFTRAYYDRAPYNCDYSFNADGEPRRNKGGSRGYYSHRRTVHVAQMGTSGTRIRSHTKQRRY